MGCPSNRIRVEYGKLEVEHCDGSVVMFGARYGQVVQWKEDQAHYWITIGYPRAQLVLESQAMVMGTIRKVVERLLEGVEIDSMSSKWDELVQTTFEDLAMKKLGPS